MNCIFVFGSNLLGIHGAGAAAYAASLTYGARQGKGEGLMGRTYALPTCSKPGKPLRIDQIADHVDNFRRCAKARPDLYFILTAVGCGIAGFTPEEIAGLFLDMPDNVYFQSKLAYGFLPSILNMETNDNGND